MEITMEPFTKLTVQIVNRDDTSNVINDVTAIDFKTMPGVIAICGAERGLILTKDDFKRIYYVRSEGSQTDVRVVEPEAVKEHPVYNEEA
jgi:hypothetical protein